MSSGSTAIVDDSGLLNFTAADIGQPIWVIGAENPIGDGAGNGMLRTVIVAVADSTHATTQEPATESTSGFLNNATLFRLRGWPLIGSGNVQFSLTSHDVASFTFLDTLPKPEIQQPVLFRISGDDTFGGVIDNIEGSNVPGTNLGRWNIDCVSWDKLSYKRTTGEPSTCTGSPAVCNPNAGLFQNMLVSEIFKYLIVNELDGEGLDFVGAADGPVLPTFQVSFAQCGDAFDQAVKAGSDATTNLHWFTDANKKVWLADQTTFTAPWNISDADPGSILADVKCTWDNSEYVNKTIVRVGQEISSPITQTFTGDGSTKQFQLANPAAATPTILEDGVEVSVGVQGVNTGSAWYWNQGSTQITQDPAGAPLAMGVVLSVTCPQFVQANEEYSNAPAVLLSQQTQSGTGISESVVQQDGPATVTDAVLLAQAVAEQYGVIPKRLQIKTFRPGLKIGQNITVTLARFNLSAAPFCISDVQITTDENVILYTVNMVGSPLINWDYRATLATLRPGGGSGAGGGGGAPSPQLFFRTIDVNDTAIGNNIAPNVTVMGTGPGTKIVGVLRKTITSDLVVRVNCGGSELGTLTIPSATAVKTPVSTPIKTKKLVENQVLTFDITGSDGSKDRNGVATITVEWGIVDQVSLTSKWMGTHDDVAIYQMGQAVNKPGSPISSWISLQDNNIGHDPNTSPDWWDLLAEHGQDGAPGVGVPTGGTAGQVLTKVSATDYDDTWADPADLLPLTTKGDLVTYGPAGSPAVNQLVRLPVGNDLQVLTADSTALYGIEWAGDYQVYVNGTPVSIDLDVECDGNFITINGSTGAVGTVTSVAMTVPTGFSISGSPVTSSGTLALSLSTETANTVFAGPTTGSAATPTFRAIVEADLPLGSSSAFGAVKVDNTTITATAGVISAVGGGGSGALVLLEQHTASTSANLSFTTFYSSAYDEYMIEIVNLIPDTNNIQGLITVSTDGGSTYSSTTYYSRFFYFFGASSGIVNGATSSWPFTGTTLSSDTHLGAVGSIKLFSPGSSTLYKMITGECNYYDGANDLIKVSIAGRWSTSTAVNALRFAPSSGNWASGTIRIYGITK